MAILTAQTEESVGQNSAAQETFEFFRDVLGKFLPLQFRQSLKRAKVPGDGSIQDGFIRPTRAVKCRRLASHDKACR